MKKSPTTPQFRGITNWVPIPKSTPTCSVPKSERMENPIHQAKPLSHEVHAGAGCDGPGDPLDGCSGLMDRLDPPTARAGPMCCTWRTSKDVAQIDRGCTLAQQPTKAEKGNQYTNTHTSFSLLPSSKHTAMIRLLREINKDPRLAW